MSEWWRRSKRLEEPGEVAPSGRARLAIVSPPEPVPSDASSVRSGLVQRLQEIEVRLATGNPRNEYGQTVMRAAEWSRLRTRLLDHKAKVTAELQRANDRLREENIERSAVSRDHHGRLLALLLACRTILVGFDLSPEEQEVVNAAGEYLKNARLLP